MLPIIETQAKKTIQAMAERAHDHAASARKQEAERRLLIMQDQWRNLAMSYVGSLYQTAEVRRAVQKRVKTTTNVLRQLANQVCVAYERQPLRRLVDAPEASSRAFAKVLREAKIATRAVGWERKTFGLNVALVVPVVRHGQLDYVTLLPHCFEVVADPENPIGDPLAVVVELANTSDRPGRKLRYAVLDDRAWHYFDERAVPMGKPTFHGAGVFPGTPFRLSDPTDDWFDQFRGEGIVEATLQVAHLRARMDYVRFHQDRFKEMFMTAQQENLTVQVVSAEAAVEFPVDPHEARWQVEDMSLSINEHRAHIRDHIEAAAESVGIPVSAVDVSKLIESVTPLGHLLSHKAAEKVRAEHVSHLDQAEHDLHWKSALVMRGMGHPLARHLDPALVRKSFEVAFIPAPFVQDPLTQLQVDKAEVDQGLASTYQIYMRRHPGTTLEEAMERVDEIAAQEARLDTIYMKHGLPKDSSLRRASREQLLGVIGGQRSGEVRGGQAQEALHEDNAQ